MTFNALDAEDATDVVDGPVGTGSDSRVAHVANASVAPRSLCFGLLARWLSQSSDRTVRRLQRDLSELSDKIRLCLDADEVLTTSIEVIHHRLHPARTSVWLTTGRTEPALAHTVGETIGESGKAALCVLECVRRHRPSWNALSHCLAVPIVTPRSGLVGVICLERTTENADQHNFVEAVTREVGLALEAAHLYERAVAEKEKAEAILARVGDGVLVTNAAGHVIQVNEAGERIVGCARDEIVGRQCGDVLSLQLGDQPLDCSSGCALLNLHRKLDREEIWRLSEGGNRQPLLASAEAVRDSSGSIGEVVHSFRDITRLREADEAKALFLATASHELKTPLTVIQGYSEMLLKDAEWDAKGEQNVAAEAIHRRAEELNNIVDRILMSSRIETGRAQVTTEALALEPIITERVEAFQAATETQGIVNVAPGLPEAEADQDALMTIVDHLLDNALKYSSDGGTITVTMTFDDSSVTFSVADEGIGMDSEQVSKCFDQFWQAESSDARRFGGTGLGLYIVRSLVESMDGNLWVESSLGEGTTFFVRLQRAGATASVARQTHPGDQSGHGIGERSIVREFMRQIGVPTGSNQ